MRKGDSRPCRGQLVKRSIYSRFRVWAYVLIFIWWPLCVLKIRVYISLLYQNTEGHHRFIIELSLTTIMISALIDRNPSLNPWYPYSPDRKKSFHIKRQNQMNIDMEIK